MRIEITKIGVLDVADELFSLLRMYSLVEVTFYVVRMKTKQSKKKKTSIDVGSIRLVSKSVILNFAHRTQLLG